MKISEITGNKKTVLIISIVAVIVVIAAAVSLAVIMSGSDGKKGAATEITESAVPDTTTGAATATETAPVTGAVTEFAPDGGGAVKVTTAATEAPRDVYTDYGGGKSEEHVRPVLSDSVLVVVGPNSPLSDDFGVFLSEITEGKYAATQCISELNEMLTACEAAGNSPYIIRAFMNADEIEKEYRAKVEELCSYGFVRDDAEYTAAKLIGTPGASEFQTGLAFDIVDTYDRATDKEAQNTPTGAWLIEHCAEYGFIVRFPYLKSNSTGVDYTPWHFRYVGKSAAAEMKTLGFCFEEYIAYLTENERR